MDGMIKTMLQGLAVVFGIFALVFLLKSFVHSSLFLPALISGGMSYGFWRWSGRTQAVAPRARTMEEILKNDHKITSRDVQRLGQIAIQAGVSFDDSPSLSGETVDVRTIPGGIVLNPSGRLPITLNGLNLEQFSPVAKALNSHQYIPEVKARLSILLAAHNVSSPEIDHFITEVGHKYHIQRKALLSQHDSYETWSPADKEDLLGEVSDDAVNSLGLCIKWDDIGVLLNEKPDDMTADDAITGQFTDEPVLLQRYLGLVSSGKVQQPYDADDRKRLEMLASKGLAVNGAKLPLEKLLGGMLLKDINPLIEDVAPKKFSRKADAIAFAMTIPDLAERIGKTVPLRSSYYCPMPEGGGMQAAIRAMRYTGEYAGLIVSTLITEARVKRSLSDSHVKRWRIENFDAESCPYCAAHVDKIINARARSSLPPHHYGCSCLLAPEYEVNTDEDDE